MTFAARTIGYSTITGANTGTIYADAVVDNTGFITFNGFDLATGTNPVRPYGSVNPSTFTDGKIFYGAYNYLISYPSSVTACYLRISGFSSNPTKTGYYTNFTIGGVTKSATSATSYNYDTPNGIAEWYWSGQLWSFSGGTVAWTKA